MSSSSCYTAAALIFIIQWLAPSHYLKCLVTRASVILPPAIVSMSLCHSCEYYFVLCLCLYDIWCFIVPVWHMYLYDICTCMTYDATLYLYDICTCMMLHCMLLVCAQVHLCHAVGHVCSGEGELQWGIQVIGDGHVAARSWLQTISRWPLPVETASRQFRVLLIFAA